MSPFSQSPTTETVDSARPEAASVFSQFPEPARELAPVLAAPVEAAEKALAVAATVDEPAPIAPKAVTLERLRIGARKLALAQEAMRMMEAQPGMSQKAVAKRLKVSEPSLCRCLEKLRAKPDATAEDFAPGVSTGRRPKHRFTAAEEKAVKAKHAKSNRTWNAGSAPEAVRAAIRAGEIRPELADALTQREAEGKSILTVHLNNQVRVSEATIRAARSPRNAWLDYVSSPGSLQLLFDPNTCEERLHQPGEAFTIDDGTINMACCVPIERRGDKCFDNFGVMVGRFQFLLVADHASYFLPGFGYTARPRGSYRAEDLTATFHNTFRQWGYPGRVIMEKGISASNLVHDTFAHLGVEVQHASSPHQKIVEMVFNNLWTILSLQPGQVGRYQGEEEELCKTLESCRRGERDPRKHFPMLKDVLEALRQAIAVWNGHRVKSVNYGEWIPEELFMREGPKHLRRLAPEDAWMFSPVITPPRKVKGFMVGHTVQMMEGLSVRFDFGGQRLADYHRAAVKLHFNPFGRDTQAVATLAEDFAGQKAGLVIGQVDQINRMTRFHRRALGYGLDLDNGRQLVAGFAQSLRRRVQAVLPKGGKGLVTDEVRDITGASLEATPRLEEQNPIDIEAQPAPRRAAVAQPAYLAQDDPELREALENLADE